MAEIGDRRGAVGGMGLILMVVAFLLGAGFLYWLSVSAEGTDVEVVENGENGDTATGTASTAPRVELAVIRGNASEYYGQEVRVPGVVVASLLGPGGRLFFLRPDDNPYLVHLDSAAAARARPVRPNYRGWIAGTVHERTDSVLDAWEAEGGFGSGDRVAAEFAGSFIEVTQFNLEPAQEGQGSGG